MAVLEPICGFAPGLPPRHRPQSAVSMRATHALFVWREQKSARRSLRARTEELRHVRLRIRLSRHPDWCRPSRSHLV